MPVAAAIAENATLFMAYNQIQILLARLTSQPVSPTAPKPLSHLLIASAGAGAATSFVLTPFELIKCRMQVQMMSSSAASPLAKPPGPLTLIRQTLQENGIKGMWLGQTGTFLRETGGGMAWFLGFELAVRYFVAQRGPQATKSDVSLGEFMLGGAAAGTGYTVLFFPADSIKSTIQTAQELGRTGDAEKGFLGTGKDIYRNRGIKGLYSGCGVTILKSAPSSALIFAIYSYLERFCRYFLIRKIQMTDYVHPHSRLSD